MIAIIGGRGLTELSGLQITHRQVMRTPYGEPSCAFTFGKLNNAEVVFLARHGYSYTIPPHLVNYRANLWALKEQGVKEVISVATVGGIRSDLSPGTLILPDQIIDYTHGRDSTFFDVRNNNYRNIDFTHPYSETLRQKILSSAQEINETCIDSGIYAATQGPRLDSIAEVNRYERDGADMVGMTGMPETALAMELDLNYATIAAVVNHAAGRGSSNDHIDMEAVNNTADSVMARVRKLIEHTVSNHGN